MESKKYKVGIDMKYSHDLLVTATSKTEAKKKALARFIKKLKPKDFDLSAEEY